MENGYSVTICYHNERTPRRAQGEQFGRIAYRLLDPNVFVVFVAVRALRGV